MLLKLSDFLTGNTVTVRRIEPNSTSFKLGSYLQVLGLLIDATIDQSLKSGQEPPDIECMDRLRPLHLRICIVGLAMLLAACTRDGRDEKGSTKVSVELPQISGAGSGKVFQSLGGASSVGGLTLVGGQSMDPSWGWSISSSSEINCYLVMVGGTEPEFSKNHCKARGTGAELTRFGPFEGGVPAGQSISFDLNSNTNRTFYLLGGQANSGACVSFKGPTGPNKAQMSYFRLLDKKSAFLTAGEMRIVMKVPSALSSLTEMDECQVDGPGGGGGSEGINLAEMFGDGRDGSFAFTANSAVNYMSNSLLSVASGGWSATAGSPVPSTRIMGSSYQVYEIKDNGNSIVTTASFSTPAFDVGDEIIWNVVAASGSPPDSACGGNLYRGIWGTGKITAVDHVSDSPRSKMLLDRPITSSPGTLNTLNIQQTMNVQGTNFCRIHVHRIPSIQSLHTGGFNVNFLSGSAPFNYNSGGLFIMRIKNLNLGASGSLTFDATAKGIRSAPATYLPGSSWSGDASTSNVNSNEGGGGQTSPDGAGGGNAGVGGNSYNGAFGGMASLFCLSPENPTGACWGWSFKKIFMGSSGGSLMTAGGAGGGMVLLFVETLNGTGGNLSVLADGASLASQAGGGAGGHVLVMVQRNLMTAGTVTLSANGGAVTGGNGGAGGGGIAEYYSCSSTVLPVVSAAGGIASGSNPGAPGGAGRTFIHTAYSSLCPQY